MQKMSETDKRRTEADDRVYYRLWGKVSYRDQLSGSETESARCIAVAGRRESSV